jgi:hypothetical protein
MMTAEPEVSPDLISVSYWFQFLLLQGQWWGVLGKGGPSCNVLCRDLTSRPGRGQERVAALNF